MPFVPTVETPEEQRAMEVARVGFMAACPFYAHLFYAEMREFATRDIPTLCTDGRTVFYNPAYVLSLKTPEAVFALAHEVDHFLCRHPQRMDAYKRAGDVDGTPFDQEQFNVSADYVVNAMLLETGVGLMNPSWCYADDVTGEDLIEHVYARKHKKKPEQSGNPGQGKGGGNAQGQGNSTYGSSGKAPKGAKRDAAADAAGGSFDSLLPPPTDPVTGKQDVPDPAEFREAVARAAAAAKAMGNMPGALQKRVDEILAPQVDWRDHVRMLLTGKMGSRAETWNKPNRRRLALDPIVIMPGKRGFGAELVAVMLDTSGSIYASPKALEAFFAEVGGVLADIRPKRVILIECDMTVGRVSEASTLDELEYTRKAGVTGGGGTSFVPPFEYLASEGLVPDTAIYLTDLMGRFPPEPSYPVVWCTIEDGAVPFGDKVVIKA